ncbi:MAG: NADPH-dependent FMN reductase [Woeseia sp.]
MIELIGMSGSLRQGSYNTALLRAAATMMPDGARLEIKSIEDIPLYNGDTEKAEGIPHAVAALKDAIAASDGLLLATPEYNNSMPGVFKNAIDWLTRPPSDIQRVFHGRPVALMGASPGGFGTILSQNAWLPVLRTLRADFWSGGKVLVSRVNNVVDEQGDVVDEKTLEQLREFVAGFAEYAGSRG